MNGLASTPEWVGTALLGAVIAAVGYVVKLLLEWFTNIRNQRRVRRARLVELHSLLRASNAAFGAQCDDRDELRRLIISRRPDLNVPRITVEQLFIMTYEEMNEHEEKPLHLMIRSITEFTLYSLNVSMLEWLKKDDYFKAAAKNRSEWGEFAKRLEDLEVHLLLWLAKFQHWIPGHEKHALVYLADEAKHGIGFPRGIEKDVEIAIKRMNWLKEWILRRAKPPVSD